MAGYSKRTLGEKLGLKQDDTLLVVQSPYLYTNLVTDISQKVIVISNRLAGEKSVQPSCYVGDLSSLPFLEMTNKTFDFIHFFSKDREELERIFPLLKKRLTYNGMLWVSWPKNVSKIESTLNENIVMQIGLENGLVDVKVIAVDETWSGLKFVYRLKDRK